MRESCKSGTTALDSVILIRGKHRRLSQSAVRRSLHLQGSSI